MDKMSKFGSEFRNLLVEKINNKELDIPIEKARHTSLNFELVDNELRYYIDTEILDKLCEKDLKEIESLWQSLKIK